MASLQGATEGSLAEHDIIISISQEAINRQLKLLYDKPIRADKNTGISGHIKCPTIDFKGVTEPNTARITFQFEKVENGDSVFSEYIGIGPEAELLTTTINGWTMSWIVRLSEKKFEDINKELLDPVKDDTQPNIAHPNTVKALEAIDSRHFTVSAIFCMFEDALLTKSFEIRDENGSYQDNTSSFMKSVNAYFTDLQHAVQPGTQTADHPYVLGYGLAQKVPDLHETNPTLKMDDTPKYLIPKSYQVTTTPGYIYTEGQARKDSPYSNGTLNFCILTWRESYDPEPVRVSSRTNLARNANSGKLSQSLFDLTKTGEHDGIIGIACDLIFDKFLGKLAADTFFIDPKPLIPDQGDDNARKDRAWECQPGKIISRKPLIYECKLEFDAYGGRVHTFHNDRIDITGFSRTTVKWDSDLQTNSNVSDKDALRRAYLTADSQVKMTYSYVDTGFFSDTKIAADFDVACRFGLVITAGKGGVIDIAQDPGRMILPEIKDGEISFKPGLRPDGQYGAYLNLRGDHAFIELGNLNPRLFASNLSNMALPQWIQELAAAMDAVAGGLQKAIEKKSNITFANIRNKIIMPAGNVFNYAGVDVDSQGNMFAHIAFALGAENVSRTGGGKSGELMRQAE